MNEREFILNGNWQMLDGVYNRLKVAEELASKRFSFILKQQHEINDLKRLVSALYEICSGEFPEDQWDEFYKPIRDAQKLLGKGSPE